MMDTGGTVDKPPEFYEDRAKHHFLCSAAGWPCPIGCEKWHQQDDERCKWDEHWAALAAGRECPHCVEARKPTQQLGRHE